MTQQAQPQPDPAQVQLQFGANAIDTPNGPAVLFIFVAGPAQFQVVLDETATAAIAEALPQAFASAAADVRRKKIGLLLPQNGGVPADLSKILGGGR